MLWDGLCCQEIMVYAHSYMRFCSLTFSSLRISSDAVNCVYLRVRVRGKISHPFSIHFFSVTDLARRTLGWLRAWKREMGSRRQLLRYSCDGCPTLTNGQSIIGDDSIYYRSNSAIRWYSRPYLSVPCRLPHVFHSFIVRTSVTYAFI
jgi:hypothetical protein